MLGPEPVRRWSIQGMLGFFSKSLLEDFTFQWAALRVQMTASGAWPWI